jgi:hypothetical protein
MWNRDRGFIADSFQLVGPRAAVARATVRAPHSLRGTEHPDNCTNGLAPIRSVGLNFEDRMEGHGLALDCPTVRANRRSFRATSQMIDANRFRELASLRHRRQALTTVHGVSDRHGM